MPDAGAWGERETGNALSKSRTGAITPYNIHVHDNVDSTPLTFCSHKGFLAAVVDWLAKLMSSFIQSPYLKPRSSNVIHAGLAVIYCCTTTRRATSAITYKSASARDAPSSWQTYFVDNNVQYTHNLCNFWNSAFIVFFAFFALFAHQWSYRAQPTYSDCVEAMETTTE